MFDVPILLLVFNRPEPTQKVLALLERLKVSKIYVSADGPRAHKSGETQKCQAVRQLFQNLPWNCEVKTFFRNDNLGCRAAVSSGIDWFFEQEEMGIILEDDCIPDASFFPFAKALLERYQNDESIGMISGHNPLSKAVTDQSYFLSRQALIWGWATWRRAWKLMDLDMNGLPNRHSDAPLDFLMGFLPKVYLFDKWQSTKEKKNDSWAYAWAYSMAQNQKWCILPQHNLIHNAGTGEDATHTKSNKQLTPEIKTIKFPLRHNPIKANHSIENSIFYASQKRWYRLPLWYLRNLKKKWFRFLANSEE